MDEEAFRYIDDLRKTSKLTHQQIAELSGVPVGTVSRILSGQTKDPGFASMAAIVTAMGGSLDELMGIAPERQSEVSASVLKHTEYFDRALNASQEAYQSACENIKTQYEAELSRVREYLHIKDNWLRWMFAYCVVITVILAAVCVFRL